MKTGKLQSFSPNIYLKLVMKYDTGKLSLEDIQKILKDRYDYWVKNYLSRWTELKSQEKYIDILMRSNYYKDVILQEQAKMFEQYKENVEFLRKEYENYLNNEDTGFNVRYSIELYRARDGHVNEPVGTVAAKEAVNTVNIWLKEVSTKVVNRASPLEIILFSENRELWDKLFSKFVDIQNQININTNYLNYYRELLGEQ